MSDAQDVQNLSEAGRAIWQARGEILKLWEQRLRETVKSATHLKQPIIINTLPAYIEVLAKILSPGLENLGLEETENIASEHGGERARLSHYEPSDLIQEYQILRWVVFEVLHQKKFLLSLAEIAALNRVIDGTVRKAVTSFELVQLQIREQFIATLTHDLRNPLGAADMAAELILDELSNPKEVTFLVHKIKDNLEKVNRMIQDLLDATFVRSGGRLRLKIHEVDMLDIIQEVVRDQSLVHGRRFKVNASSIKGFWDKRALSRALSNLLSNAIKYGDPHVSVSIDLEEANQRVILKVHNSGSPIPVAEQEAIFQIFRRAQAAKSGEKKGWGLGLPLVRGVAESHGGSISVTSTEESGTTFILDIPQDARPFQEEPAFS